MNKQLEEKIKTYYDLKQQIDTLKKSLDILGNDLKTELEKENIKKETTSNGYEVNLISKTTIKYTDEEALKNFLKILGKTEYLIESIDNKRLNESIKASESFKKDISNYINENISNSLMIKEVK